MTIEQFDKLWKKSYSIGVEDEAILKTDKISHVKLSRKGKRVTIQKVIKNAVVYNVLFMDYELDGFTKALKNISKRT